LARGAGLSEKLISLLDGQKDVFSINITSYPDKARRIASARNIALGAIAIAWGILGGIVVIGVITVLIPRIPNLVELLVVVVIILIVIAMLLPATLSSRASSRQADAVNRIRQIGLASIMADESRSMDAPVETPGAAPVRVRKHFPETLLWRPELITDDSGVAELEIDLADSITTWRLSASAVSADGNLGGADFPIRVFQPFFVDLDLPVALTRNDEVAVPVVVYNYLDKPQTVELEFSAADWFVRLAVDESGETEVGDDGKLRLELKPGEVRSLNFPIRVEKVGRQQLQVTARGSGIADAVRREIEVVPDGRRVEKTSSGALDEPLTTTLSVPETAIEGSVRAIVKLYPSTFSQLVEGLDAIFQMPYGCFEQTSSTTYPNVLALDYLQRTKKSAPAIEAKARQYIHIGYQRLVSFEVSGGGFDWFGRPPANRTLTAYGLMEFEDMARVHDVDPKLIERTRRWLLSRRTADGSWKNESGMLNDGLAGSVQRGGSPNLATTAYIAWAVFSGDLTTSEADVTLNYLLSHSPASIDDPYLLALVSNAIAAIDRQHPKLRSYLARLEAMKRGSDDGKKVWWEQQKGRRTTFYGGGRSGNIETTALAVLAMTSSGQYGSTAGKALSWLIEQKDPRGTWHSTQATVLALKALVAGTGSAIGQQRARSIEIALDGDPVRRIEIPVDQADVMQQIDLSSLVSQPGQYELRLADRSQAATGYQLAFRFHVDEDTAPNVAEEALAVSVQYDRTQLEVDDRVTCIAAIKNNLSIPAPMVIVDLPIPGGFTIEQGELAELVGSGKIARYQITPRKAIIYLRQLGPGATLDLRYRLKATMPVKVAVPAVHAYHYYDPDQQGSGGATQLVATSS
ncbi:MAG: alpha-2-macroglobulin family protein, partial [Pirellulales bacterium]